MELCDLWITPASDNGELLLLLFDSVSDPELQNDRIDF